MRTRVATRYVFHKFAGRSRNIALKGLVALLLGASLVSLAQNSKTYRLCNQKAKTQSEMNVCANEEAARVDGELNQVYGALLSKSSAQPEATAKIKAAEKAWIAYRDAYMDAMYPAADKQGEYGTIYPMEANEHRARLTRQHVKELEEMLRQYEGDR